MNRPFRNTLALKGAYTLSRAKNMTNNDEDGWTALTWNTPLMYDQNFALAGFDRTHNAQLGVVWEMPFFSNDNSVVGRVLQGWHWNGIVSAFSGAPYSIRGTNPGLDCQGCGDANAITINVSQDPKPTGSVGSSTEPVHPLEIFSQPTGANVAGFGNSGRNKFRRPPVWNVDMSLFRSFQVGRLQPQIRVAASNVFNHTTWNAPGMPATTFTGGTLTNFTANNFMRFTPSSAFVNPRTVVVGLRVQF